MVERIVLHIGTEKTGTSALQVYFHENRAVYRAQGVLYPETIGPVVHEPLAAFAAADHKRDDLRRNRLIVSDEDLAAFRAEVRTALSREVERAGCSTVLLSNEHCHSRLRSIEEIERLRSLLAPICPRIEVYVYFRRQDTLALSWYSTRVKSGFKQQIFFPEMDLKRLYYFDHWKIYSQWAQVMGKEQVHVRLYEPKSFVNGDLIDDFADFAHLPLPQGCVHPARRNESLSGAATEFLRLFNNVFPSHIEGVRNPDRTGIVQLLEAHVAGKPVMPPRQQALEFMALFAEGNEKLRLALGLTHRETLFDMDFSRYPEAENALDPQEILSNEEAVRIASLIWQHAHAFKKP
ncbi:MAG: hypothetical protein MRY63_08140 [Neomegalonema sp.]|nr:hypothetical protein [Neomegalonema sp.]